MTSRILTWLFLHRELGPPGDGQLALGPCDRVRTPAADPRPDIVAVMTRDTHALFAEPEAGQ